MASASNPVLKEVFGFLDQAFKTKANSVIVTVPGLGLSHLLKQYSSLNSTAYITDLIEDSSVTNIINYDFQKKGPDITPVDKYFKKHRTLQPKNTFITIVNSPSLIETSEFQKSYFTSHAYNYFYFHPWPADAVSDFIVEQGIVITPKQEQQIIHYSGGIIRIAKYLLFHPQLLDQDRDLTASNPEFIRLIKSTIDVLGSTPKALLHTLKLWQNDSYVSPLLNSPALLPLFPHSQNVFIELFPDLRFKENDHYSSEVLTKFEKDLLAYIMSHNYFVTRDQLSDLKWKKDSFEKYSDQAINKAVSRLNDKLKHHHLKAVSKAGYRLEGK